MRRTVCWESLSEPNRFGRGGCIASPRSCAVTKTGGSLFIGARTTPPASQVSTTGCLVVPLESVIRMRRQRPGNCRRNWVCVLLRGSCSNSCAREPSAPIGSDCTRSSSVCPKSPVPRRSPGTTGSPRPTLGPSCGSKSSSQMPARHSIVTAASSRTDRPRGCISGLGRCVGLRIGLWLQRSCIVKGNSEQPSAASAVGTRAQQEARRSRSSTRSCPGRALPEARS